MMNEMLFELLATLAAGQVILPVNLRFCHFQYRVRPGEKMLPNHKKHKSQSLLQNSQSGRC